MIIKTLGYKSSDGTIHGSLAEAQKSEMLILLNQAYNEDDVIRGIADHILKNQEKVIDILTMTSKSKPRARKINGGTKTRPKKSTRHEAEQFPLPMEDTTQPAA